MPDIKYLYDTIGDRAYRLGIPFTEIPNYISENLRYPFFAWQKKAFENFLTFHAIEEKEPSNEPTHLMFNMATGTGKTLLMAAAILYYWQQGYRHFLFFVNQNNIIDKTENNFINTTHSKYLFAETIMIDNQTVKIEKVNTFSSNSEALEMKFTTIQKLYNDIHIEKENQLYLDDLLNRELVMLADEGHHLNADTQRGAGELALAAKLTNRSGEGEIERKGWEHTVIELLLNKNGSQERNRNVLLEFTATIPNNQKVIEKYAPKTIYSFGLSEFLSAGYTKEINLLSSTLNKRERILQALLFSWYRHKIALKRAIPNFKPVILFRSKEIKDSEADFEEFLNMIKDLTEKDFEFLEVIEYKCKEGDSIYQQGRSRIRDLIKFIQEQDIQISEIVSFMKDNFNRRNCIITNSKTNRTLNEKTNEEQERLLNSLEDSSNHIRAIFTVKRLNEGWDVLNLFDIVRLYTGRDERKNRRGDRLAGKATISEVQLIGRGVRYYPFSYNGKERNRRKFDNHLQEEMRVLEELYYHCDSDHRYISELKRELKKRGYIDDRKIEKCFPLKRSFTSSAFYKDMRLWKNEQITNPERRKKTLDSLKRDFENFEFPLEDLEIREEEVDLEREHNDRERLSIHQENKRRIPAEIKEFERHIFYKAVHIKTQDNRSLLRFKLLKKELQIESIDDFRENTIGDFKIVFITAKRSLDEVTNREKLNALIKFFDTLLTELKQAIKTHKGTELQPKYKLPELFGEEIKKRVERNDDSQRIEEILKDKTWYVVEQFYGTCEEREFIEFIQKYIGNLQEKYEEVYLLRNEAQYEIYDFDTGRGFQPDFLLFLRGQGRDSKLYYQIFIEPKGQHLLKHDKWKNDFLNKIKEEYSENNILTIQGKNYTLIALPLFNHQESQDFTKAFKELIQHEA